MNGVVILVIIIIMSKTVLPEQNRGPGTQKNREVTDFTGKVWTEPTGAHGGGSGAGESVLTSPGADPGVGHKR